MIDIYTTGQSYLIQGNGKDKQVNAIAHCLRNIAPQHEIISVLTQAQQVQAGERETVSLDAYVLARD